MPEGTEETAVAESTEAPAAEEATEEASPPDLSDALSQMQESIGRIESRLPAEEEEPTERDPWQALSQQPDPYEEYYDDEPEPAPQQQGQLTEEQQQAEQMAAYIGELVEQRVNPVVEQMQAQQREKEVRALAEKYPNFSQPDRIDHVANVLDNLAQQYGDERIRTDPVLAEQVYLAYEAQQAQASGGPEGSQEGTAEAVGQGANLETGAGPGAPDEEIDPTEKAYLEALQGRGTADPFGL